MSDEPRTPQPLDDAELPPMPEEGGRYRPHGRFPVERAIAAIAIFLIVAISAANVIVRYATNYSFAFTEEYSVLLLVVITFAGSAAAARDDGHIRILAFANRFDRKVRRWMLIVSTAATVLMFLLVIWYAAILVLDEYRFGDRTAGLGNPAWLYTAVMPVLCVPIILRVIKSARDRWRRGEP